MSRIGESHRNPSRTRILLCPKRTRSKSASSLSADCVARMYKHAGVVRFPCPQSSEDPSRDASRVRRDTLKRMDCYARGAAVAARTAAWCRPGNVSQPGVSLFAGLSGRKTRAPEGFVTSSVYGCSSSGTLPLDECHIEEGKHSLAKKYRRNSLSDVENRSSLVAPRIQPSSKGTPKKIRLPLANELDWIVAYSLDHFRATSITRTVPVRGNTLEHNVFLGLSLEVLMCMTQLAIISLTKSLESEHVTSEDSIGTETHL